MNKKRIPPYTTRLNSKILYAVQVKLTAKSKVKQINKNNKTNPKNLEKKQYERSLAELKKDIKVKH